MSRRIHLFLYGTLRANGMGGELLENCERVREASVPGTLFDIDGRFPALMLYGADAVHGALWRCAPERVLALDEYEAVSEGLFRRVGIEVDGIGCWTYVAGPALAARLLPEHRIAAGRWTAPIARSAGRGDRQKAERAT